MNAVPVFMHPTLKYLTLLMSVLFNPQAPNPATVEPLAFSGSHWRKVSYFSHYEQYTARQRMIQDVQEKVLPGRPKYEIRGVLGSDESRYMGSSASLQGGDMAYYLGKVELPSGSFSNQWLVLFFDEKGSCSKTIIVTEGRF